METKNNSIGHETEDASIRGILYAGAGLAITTGLSLLLVYGIFEYLADHPATTEPFNPMAETEQQQFPPVPRIEDHPTVELKDLRAQEDRLLSTYGWSDKKAGVVRIPIDRAMQLQIERGFPAPKEAAK